MKILLTSCSRNSGLSVLRLLARNGHEVIATDDRALPFGLHSRFAACFERLPDASSAHFTNALLRVVRQHRPDVVLPIMGSRAVSEGRKTFEQEAHVLVPPLEAYEALSNKRTLLEQCALAGVPHPRLLTLEQAQEGLVTGRLPAIVIKPCQDFGGGKGVSIVADGEQVRSVYRSVTRTHGEGILCEYIPGPDSNNFALHIVLDRASRPVCAFAYQKTRLSPLKTGITAAGVSRHATQLMELVLPMLQRLRWAGPADIEFKLDERDRHADDGCDEADLARAL